MDNCFQLQIRRFFGFRFVPGEFDLPPFQLSVPEISRGFLEGPHDEKDVSTFVLAISTLFILHNNPIRSLGFVHLTIKQTCMVSALLIGLANHREEDADGDNASPMTVAQSFPASTTAYQPPTQATPQIAGSHLSPVAADDEGRVVVGDAGECVVKGRCPAGWGRVMPWLPRGVGT